MKLRIIQDSTPQSPRDWDNLGTIVYWHRNYKLGDEYVDPYDEVNIDFDKTVYLPVYLYDHSGLTINTTGFSCPWDSGQVGYIYVDKTKLQKEYGWKRVSQSREKMIEEYLRGEIETFDQFLRGDIYGYILEDEDGNEVDSCWGFFGSDPTENGMAEHLGSYEYEVQEKIEYQS